MRIEKMTVKTTLKMITKITDDLNEIDSHIFHCYLYVYRAG